MHAQVIGTTNAGKTESVILPMAIQDIKNGSGVLIIDGKSDSGFLDKLYAYAKKYDRAGDFKLFSLVNVPCSSSFNPLRGNTPQEVTERVFSSFKFESEYYKNIQYRVFLSIVRLIFSHNEVPTFALVYKLLTDTEELGRWVENCKEDPLTKELARFLKLTEKEREERTSGLETMISHFISAEVAPLFQETDESIDFSEALAEGQILYFQIPTMLFPIMGEATGKLILQAFQSAISRRQVEKGKNSKDKGKKFLALGEDHDGGIASKSYRTDYYHDQTLIDVKGIFANCSAISDYKSEGKIRKEINQKLSSLLHWEKRGNIPDGYFHLKLPDRNLRVAIELELSDKSQKRYERIFRNHLLSKSWDLVIYLVRDETLKNYLLGLLQKSKDRDIQVRVSNMLNGIYFCELNDFLKNGLDVKLTNGRRELSFKELAQISE